MTDANPDTRALAAARRLLTLAAGAMGGGAAFRLWNGEKITSPGAPGAALELTFRTANALRRLLRHPTGGTLLVLYAEGEIDAGDLRPMQMARLADHIGFNTLGKRLNRMALYRAALPFLLPAWAGGIGGTAPAAALEFAGDAQSAKPASGRDDTALIQFHYDLSNAFYATFLDAEMVYSSAYFAIDGMELDAAQRLKLDRICGKLRLQPGEKLFDTGCGWGSLICHAARHYGVAAHGVTLAKEQFDYTQAKIARLGLEGKVTVELRDYRSITTPASYDKIAQIEMFEHLGLDNHDRHFLHMRRLLRPRGLYLHQASTRRPTRDLAKFRTRTMFQDFTNRYIFPGGELDYIGLTVTNLERLGFEVHDVEAMREHFQRTCGLWAERLHDNREAAAREVGMARTRLWVAYLAASSIAFERGTLNVFQTLASKRHLGASGLPLARDV